MGIKIRNLSFAYSETPILKNISLEVKDGEFVGIAGGTGSGKTTFALALNGIIPHLVKGKFSGDVEVSGKNTKNFQVFDLSKSVGFVFQDPDYQIFSINVEDEISFGLENMGLEKKEVKKRVAAALDALGIRDLRDKETFALSLGQKQKLCIASVLAMNPDTIVLDEPTSQLDFRGTKDIYEILKSLNNKGKTILVIEHKTEWLLKYASRMLVLDRRNFVLDGKPSDVLKSPKLARTGVEIPAVFRIEKYLKRSGIRIDFEKLAKV